jgi:hypothetical protein
MFGEVYKLSSASLCSLLQLPATSVLLGPNILLCTLLSDTLNLWSSRIVREQFLHPHGRKGEIMMKFFGTVSRVKWLSGEKTNVSKTISVFVLRLDFSPLNHLTRLIARENFIILSRRESNKSQVKLCFLYILIIRNLEKIQDKRLRKNGNKHSPKLICFSFFHGCSFGLVVLFSNV